jgi:lipoate-protein ligase A
MVHCSILYDFAIDRVARYLTIPKRQPAYRAGRAHQDFLSNVGLSRKILSDAIGKESSLGSYRPGAGALPLELVGSLVSEKYSNTVWIERL